MNKSPSTASATAAGAATTPLSPSKKPKTANDDAHDHAGLTADDRERLSAFFRQTTVADVAPTLVAAATASAASGAKPLVVLNDTDTMRQALATLNAHKISSAPVRAVATSADEKALQHKQAPNAEASFRGMLDTMDIMFFLAEQYAINKRKHDHLFDPKELDKAFDTPISVYINESGRDPFVAVSSETTLFDLMEHFFNWGLRRVPVAVANQIVASISQSDVVAYIYKHLDKLAPLGDRKMLDFHLLGTHHALSSADARGDATAHDDSKLPKLLTVLDNATVLDAVQLMTKHKVTAIGIVDVSGKLVGNFSASDLKNLTPTKMFEFEAKVVDVLIHNNTFREPVQCSVDAALRIALRRIVDGRAHRIYIVDKITHRAAGVVTLTDLIRAIVREFTHTDALGDD